MDSSRIRAVIFDMDGTLLDSERLSHKAWDAAAREIGEQVTWETFLKMVGHRSVDCMRILQNEIGRKLPAEQIIESTRKHYAALVNAGVPLMPGAREIFDFAREQRWKIGIATSTRRESTQAKLEHAGLWQHVDAATCGDEVFRGKPDPEIYLATAKKLGVPAENCLAVEDSPTGFRAAHAAGCLTVLIPDLVAPTPDVLRDAASVHPNLSALREWLKNSFPQFSLP